jgi:hypothetical protein
MRESGRSLSGDKPNAMWVTLSSSLKHPAVMPRPETSPSPTDEDDGPDNEDSHDADRNKPHEDLKSRQWYVQHLSPPSKGMMTGFAINFYQPDHVIIVYKQSKVNVRQSLFPLYYCQLIDKNYH